MRIGFSLGSLLTIREVLDCAEVLSRHSADSIWIPETWGMESGAMLASISQIAKKPKIGSSIINTYSRTPALIAMSAVTLDALSNGRLLLGLGASSKAIVEDWHGLEYAHNIGRMREYVEVIRMILCGKKVTYDGKFFHLRNFALLVKPVRTKIPIFLAAINKKMVDLAWDLGDGVIFYLRPLEEMKATISQMQSRREIDVACQLITCVSEDLEQALVRAKKTIAFYVSVGKTYREFLAGHGFEREVSAIFEEYRRSGLEETFEFVPDSMVESLALYGTPNDAVRKIEKFARAGITIPILQFNPVGNVLESFRLLASTMEEVM
ncbi:MAG: LLM class flavin-dependent oxidoreductase [Thaumarchaeota archaeon]|nr:LLM class flavin-dependent oxidoreductase [Nitrososphaerota archaeon]